MRWLLVLAGFRDPGGLRSDLLGAAFRTGAGRHAGPTSFGHDGAGGQNAFGDLQARVGFGYVNNQMGGLTDQRANLLTAALTECLGVRPAAIG